MIPAPAKRLAGSLITASSLTRRRRPVRPKQVDPTGSHACVMGEMDAAMIAAAEDR